MTSNRYNQLQHQHSQDNKVATLKPRTAHLDESNDRVLLFPAHKENMPRKPIDLTYWREYPHIYRPLLLALADAHETSNYRTLYTAVDNLENGLFLYLSDLEKKEIQLSDIDLSLMTNFTQWLNQTDNGIAKWKENTRARRYDTAWIILERLKTLPEGTILSHLKRIKNPWSGRHRRSDPIEGMSDIGFEKLYIACSKEAASTVEAFYTTRELCREKRHNILDIPCYGAKEIYSDLGNALSAVDYFFPNHIFPSTKEFQRIGGTSLYKSLPLLRRDVIPRFCPTTRSLVPFVLLMAIHYAANSISILTTRTSHFEEFDVLGIKRLRWKGEKDRSSKDPQRTHMASDEIDNPTTLFNFLLDYTAKIRKEAPPHLSDRLFLYWTQDPIKVTSYYADGRAGQGSSWKHQLIEFQKEHGLEIFNLSMLRQTVLDRVDKLFDGDIRARKTAAQHSSINVTAEHYTSSNIKKKNNERLALAISQRERYTNSGGLVDHRKGNGDKSSATPGFICADPFDSPLPDQHKNRLCTAYGRCPVCPLATVNTKSSESAAQVIQLRLTIEAARPHIMPRRFLDVWVPIINKLNQVWIPSFSQQAMDNAHEINLPSLPSIE